MPTSPDVFYEIAGLLAMAGIVGVLALWLRQPLIVAYIIVGVLAGPVGLGWVRIGNEVELLAKIGISLLLFLVGLRLDIQMIRMMGPVALATGLGQVLFTSVIGFGIGLALGMDPLSATYIAVALTFSSTIIIVKLLSDKRELDSLHGRIAVGMLIVQDIVVVLVMVVLTAFNAETRTGSMTRDLLELLIKAAGFALLVLVAMRYVLPRLVARLARSQELLLLFAIAWAVFMAAAGDYLGVSKEIGAFLAGVSLASTAYREAIGARLVSLRDLLLLLFFIELGAHLKLNLLAAGIGPAMIFSVFVLVGNPLIVMLIMGVMGYRRRTGFLTGLTVAQISEFSLILVALGVRLGHVGAETLNLVTLVGLVTIGLSTYLIIYSHPLYDRLAAWLHIFERQMPHREETATVSSDVIPLRLDVILFGLGRYGNQIGAELRARGLRMLGVDFDPRVVEAARAEGMAVQYGDAEDPECGSVLPLNHTPWVICAIPQRHVNLAILQSLRHRGYDGRIAVTAHNQYDVGLLAQAGADLVLLPFRDASKEAADRIQGDLSMRDPHVTRSVERPSTQGEQL